MRLTLAVAVACLGIVGIATADPAHAAIKKQTQIPAQALGPALTSLAQEFDFQVLYRTEVVGTLRTQGVSGAMTAAEALEHVLSGTGLTYKYLDEKTVTILPVGEVAPASNSGGGHDAAQREDGETGGQNQGGDQKKSFWDRFRLAQVDKGATSPNDGAKRAREAESSVTTGDSAKPIELQEVVITATYKFLSADTSGTTGLPLPIEKVPQSISLVDNDFIEAADLKSLGEIAEYTPGALNVGAPGNLGSAIKLRGFTPGRAIDGVDALQPAFLYEPEYAIYDRLEVVKGPSSVVYGISNPGGLVNYVTKSATPETRNYVSVQAGMWDAFRLEAQGAGSLDEAGHVRAIGVAVFDTGNSFQDWMYHNKGTLYGGLNFDCVFHTTVNIVSTGW